MRTRRCLLKQSKGKLPRREQKSRQSAALVPMPKDEMAELPAKALADPLESVTLANLE